MVAVVAVGVEVVVVVVVVVVLLFDGVAVAPPEGVPVAPVVDDDWGVGVVFPIVEFAFGVAFDDGVSLLADSPSTKSRKSLRN